MSESIVSGTESGGTMNFMVRLSEVSMKPVTVNYRVETFASNSVDTSDYSLANPSRIMIPAGTMTGMIPVTIAQDTTNESNESFKLVLHTLTNAAFANNQTTIYATGVILNGDGTGSSAIVRVNHPQVKENTGEITFRMTLSKPLSQIATFNWSTIDGTATAGSDYLRKNDQFETIEIGETEKLLRVAISADFLDEPNENFSMMISLHGTELSFGQGSTYTATGTIIDDNDAIIAKLSEPVVTADEEDGSMAFTINLVNDVNDGRNNLATSGQDVALTYRVVDGTAKQGEDFTLANGTLNITAGTSSGTINVPIIANTPVESKEQFQVIFANTENVSFGGAANLVATGVITDYATPTIEIADVTGTEGAFTDGQLEFVVTSTPAATAETIVEYSTSNGTAIAPSDYTETSGTLTFAVGDKRKFIQVPIINDNSNENSETFTITLTNMTTNATIGTATGTIVDNDDLPSLSISERIVSTEGSSSNNGQATLVVRLSEPSGKSVTVQYATQQDTATEGTDYTAKTGTVTFQPGETSQYITIDFIADAVDETLANNGLDETFTVLLSNPTNASLSAENRRGTVVIKDDDGANATTLTLSIADSAAAENVGIMVFRVTLSADAIAPVGVFWSASSESGNTAIAGTDFEASTADFSDTSRNYILFNVGERSKRILVPIKRDSVSTSNKTFTVEILNPMAGAVLTDATAIGTIQNTDLRINIADLSEPNITEGTNTSVVVNIPVRTDAQIPIPLMVDFEISGANENDFTFPASPLVFDPNSTEKNIPITVNTDRIDEDSETFTVTLIGTNFGEIQKSTSTFTIVDDDRPPVLTILDIEVPEGTGTNTNAELVAMLANASSREITADYEFSEGTATEKH